MTDLELWDVCRRKHGGNEESEAANDSIAPTKALQRERVFQAVAGSLAGLTCRELAERWEVGMNQISGRFSELKAAGRIRKTGTRDRCAIYETAK